MNENDKQDLMLDSVNDMIDSACVLVALSKEKQTNAIDVVYVDEDGNDKTIKVYDFIFYNWKSSDSFDKLANDFLGNANLGTVIAYFNKIENESNLEAGTKIKIPILQENESNTNNKIYAIPELQDNYGTDICIDENGDFAFLNGDIATINGKENLSQALTLRLTTASQKRIRLASYGIRASIGEPVAMQSYLLGSIEQTIKADPRIKSIDNIIFKGKGDTLFCEIEYTDINGEKNDLESSI